MPNTKHLLSSSSPFSQSFILKGCFIIAGVMGSCSVALQAISAHLPDPYFIPQHGRDMVHQAADIGLWHAIAVCALCLGAHHLPFIRGRFACLGMICGALLFSISVTLLGLRYIHTAPFAPLGGTLLILSWLVTASCAITKTKHR